MPEADQNDDSASPTVELLSMRCMHEARVFILL